MQLSADISATRKKHLQRDLVKKPSYLWKCSNMRIYSKWKESSERAAAGQAEPGLCTPSKLLFLGVMGAPPPPGSHLQWLHRYAGEQSKRRELQRQAYESKQTASFHAFQLGFQQALLQNKAEGAYKPAGHSSAPGTISPWMLSTSQRKL